ncbi:YozE family protein [Bacillus sp. FJAT-49711]|uniref:YozE family protein n=1 Tax=Bacillus sp. FJAT-49711 TaxID=2833585 RepID=UPI001BCA4D61|nr:YozE family protein [Bacillus sp. FJAT-49711]MBS4217384.1 YozE family protein [Bacillus sp. FJAT-49711]
MNKSFYHFLMKYRQPHLKDDISKFANDAYNDHSFPKYSDDYNEISSYLELNGGYLPTLALFDRVWELYLEAEKK